MNNYARKIILILRSKENKYMLFNNLSKTYNMPIVSQYLVEHLDNSVNHFVDSVEQELSMSDPMPGITAADQITCFNNQFIKNYVDFINAHVIGCGDTLKNPAFAYTINDLHPTSRHNIRHYEKNSNQILDSWRVDSGRGIQMREDPSGDIYPRNNYYGSNVNSCSETFTQDNN